SSLRGLPRKGRLMMWPPRARWMLTARSAAWRRPSAPGAVGKMMILAMSVAPLGLFGGGVVVPPIDVGVVGRPGALGPGLDLGQAVGGADDGNGEVQAEHEEGSGFVGVVAVHAAIPQVLRPAIPPSCPGLRVLAGRARVATVRAPLGGRGRCGWVP